MKKIILFLTLISVIGFGNVYSQLMTINVSGTVTSQTTGLPVPNQLITLTSLDSTVMLYADGLTSGNGFYSISITYIGLLPQFLVSTYDNCTPGNYYNQVFFPSPAGNIVDFVICTSNITTTCNAFYTYMPGMGPLNQFYFSDNSTGSVISWYWDFDDGSVATTQYPDHIFNYPGLYEVCLTIFTSDSCIDTYCESILVDSTIIQPPSCDAYFYYGAPGTVANAFTDLSYAATPIVAWNWSFGDGTSSSLQNPVHSYNAFGWYNVCLTIVAADSCTSTYCEDIYYGGTSTFCSAGYYYMSPGPTGSFLEVAFADISSGNIIAWDWDFGDGSSSSVQNPTHIYGNPGMYMVCLDIFTSDSCSSSWCDYVYVDSLINPPGCDAYFYYGVNPGAPLGFYDASWASTPIIGWLWSFGDGTSSTDQNPVHAYNAFGWYNVCLTITATDGCSSTYCEDIYFGGNNTFCSAGYYYMTPGPTGSLLEVAFADISSGNVIAWDWDFGDGTSSTNQNPVHTYNTFGVFQVCLDIYTSDSCSSSWCDYVYVDSLINPQGCEAYFMYDIGIFSNSSFYDMSTASTPIISWFWDFGDGTYSSDQYPIHPYNAVGYYNVCLTIMAMDSCSSTFCDTIYYSGGGTGSCQAYFTIISNPANPNDLSFVDNSNGSVISWEWSFGDGTSSTLQNPEHLYNAAGVYEVCLSIFTSDSCSSTVCQNVTIQGGGQFFSVSGNVWAGPDFVNSGAALLMGINGSIYTSDILSGSYQFNMVPTGTYIVYAIPSFIDYPDFAPTYHHSAFFWTDADEVTVSSFSAYNINVFLNQITPTSTGPCTIAGTIIWTDTTSTNTYKSRLDNNVGDISLMLFDMEDNLLHHVMSDITGNFEFGTLPYGTYKLYVELTGHTSYPAIITLDEGHPNVTDITINIEDGSIVYAVDEIISEDYSGMIIYPNPASENLNIEFSSDINSDVVISVINAFGQEIQSIQKQVNYGQNKFSLDVSGLASGIYFVSIKGNNSNSKMMKFVK